MFWYYFTSITAMVLLKYIGFVEDILEGSLA